MVTRTYLNVLQINSEVLVPVFIEVMDGGRGFVLGRMTTLGADEKVTK